MQVQTSVKTERNYGIDLLRLISMLYVLVLHALGRGGLLDHTQRLSVQYQFGWFMQLWALSNWIAKKQGMWPHTVLFNILHPGNTALQNPPYPLGNSFR